MSPAMLRVCLEIERDTVDDLKEELKREREIYRNVIVDIAKQPKNIFITQALNMSPRQVKRVIHDTFTVKHLANGQEGVASFFLEQFGKNDDGSIIYRTSDPARQHFKCTNPDGTSFKDIKAEQVTQALINGGIISSAQKMAIKEYTNPEGIIDQDKCIKYTGSAMEIADMPSNNSIFIRKLVRKTTF